MTTEVVSVQDAEIKALLEISRDDMIAVAVSRKEEELQIRKAELDLQIKDIQEKIFKRKVTLSESAEKSAKLVYNKNTAGLVKTLVLVGIDAVVTFDTAHVLSETRQISYDTDIKVKNQYSTLSGTAVIAMTKDQNCQQDEIDKLEKQMEKLQSDAIEARKALANLPIYERKVKAHLAETAMKMSPRGRSILASIESVKGIKALGLG